MKRLIICPVCQKPCGFYKSFVATVEKYEEFQGMPVPTRKRKVRICPACAEQAGYGVKKRKARTPKTLLEEGVDNNQPSIVKESVDTQEFPFQPDPEDIGSKLDNKTKMA